MDRLFLMPDRLFDGLSLLSNTGACIENNRVTALAPVGAPPEGFVPVKLDGLLSPGFVDLQVNGGGGVLFNTSPIRESALEIASAHHQFGTTLILPTVITDCDQTLKKAVQAIIDCAPERSIGGIHIEGPHISPHRRGTHAQRYIRPMDTDTISLVSALRDKNIPVMITLAPEAVSLDDIARLKGLGAVVSIGHSDATFEQTMAAVKAGASCFTHLFNAMSPIRGREPGVVGAALRSGAYTGLICDGYHVHDDVIKIVMQAMIAENRLFLVSDAMPTVGGDNHFMLYGRKLTLVNGRLINDEGSLAGAHLTLLDAVKRMVNIIGTPLDKAMAMATAIPYAVISKKDKPEPILINQAASDLIVIRDNFSDFAYFKKI